MRCQTPPRIQRTKIAYTVDVGGNSTGSCRHAIPPRTRYRMASNMSRRQCFSGLPPRPAVLPGAGSNGCSIAHCASVTDDGYAAQRCPPAAWGGHDGHGEMADDGMGGLLDSAAGVDLTNSTRSPLPCTDHRRRTPSSSSQSRSEARAELERIQAEAAEKSRPPRPTRRAGSPRPKRRPLQRRPPRRMAATRCTPITPRNWPRSGNRPPTASMP